MEKQVLPPARDLERLGAGTRKMPDLTAVDPPDTGANLFKERPDHGE
jgi:hypothetical protein